MQPRVMSVGRYERSSRFRTKGRSGARQSRKSLTASASGRIAKKRTFCRRQAAARKIAVSASSCRPRVGRSSASAIMNNARHAAGNATFSVMSVPE